MPRLWSEMSCTEIGTMQGAVDKLMDGKFILKMMIMLVTVVVVNLPYKRENLSTISDFL